MLYIITFFSRLYVRISILLTFRKHLHDHIVSLRRKVGAIITRLTLQRFIEVPLPSEESDRSCIEVPLPSEESDRSGISVLWISVLFLSTISVNRCLPRKKNKTKICENWTIFCIPDKWSNLNKIRCLYDLFYLQQPIYI